MEPAPAEGTPLVKRVGSGALFMASAEIHQKFTKAFVHLAAVGRVSPGTGNWWWTSA